MASYPVTELIGKTIYVKPGKEVQVFSHLTPTTGKGTVAFTAKQSLNKGRIGVVKFYTVFQSGVPDNILGIWLTLEPENKYLVKFNETRIKKPEGIKTTEEIEAEKEAEEIEAEKEREEKEKSFGDKALSALKTVTLVGLAGWVLISLGKEKIKSNRPINI